MDRKKHWDDVHRNRDPREMSWFQPRAALSLELIETALPDRSSPILDVGAGTSTLVDGLLELGYRRITVLELSPSALGVVRRRIGDRGGCVSFVSGDVTTVSLEPSTYALWHDRAVFHFLTDPEDRRRYIGQVRQSVVPGGLVLVATFAEDGPVRCSGLDTVRYSADQLLATFGSEFEGLEFRREAHRTPTGATQWFTYCLCRLRAGGA